MSGAKALPFCANTVYVHVHVLKIGCTTAMLSYKHYNLPEFPVSSPHGYVLLKGNVGGKGEHQLLILLTSIYHTFQSLFLANNIVMLLMRPFRNFSSALNE